jgi:hypothetical protein
VAKIALLSIIPITNPVEERIARGNINLKVISSRIDINNKYKIQNTLLESIVLCPNSK